MIVVPTLIVPAVVLVWPQLSPLPSVDPVSPKTQSGLKVVSAAHDQHIYLSPLLGTR